jgi:mannosylglycoprotein endo-beta-mannosidase
MLFILVMEPLQRLFEIASSTGLLSPINNRTAKLRASLYADGAAIFVNPIKEDIQVVADILVLFGKVSGLITNRDKCAVYPVQCEGIDIATVMEGFSYPIKSFPCTYLGLLLHLRQLRRVDFQPLFDKLANRLPTWKGKFLNKAGRLQLLNSVLSTIPTYFLTMFALKK